MMEAMSFQNPPPEQVCKNILHKDVLQKYPNFDSELLINIVDEEFKKYGGYKMLGSLTGWNIFSRKELTNNICIIVDSYKKENYETFTLVM